MLDDLGLLTDLSQIHLCSSTISQTLRAEYYLPCAHPAPSPTHPPSFLLVASPLLCTDPLSSGPKLIPRIAKRVSPSPSTISLRLMPRLLMAVVDFLALRVLCWQDSGGSERFALNPGVLSPTSAPSCAHAQAHGTNGDTAWSGDPVYPSCSGMVRGVRVSRLLWSW
jgi:hypothetical protein